MKGWIRFWGTRVVALVPTVLIAVLSNASNSFDRLNALLNIVQSIQLPFALIPVSGQVGQGAVHWVQRGCDGQLKWPTF